jgi:hypothetical protein
MGTPDLTTYLWDVSNNVRPVKVCSLIVPDPGPIRFVSASTVSVKAHNILYTLNLKTRAMNVLARWPDPAGIAEYDTAPDGSVTAYAISDGKGGITFHVVKRGTDTLISSFPEAGFGGIARVEFSPSGKYFAVGATSATAVNKTSPVEVWTRDGNLVFSSPGTTWLTWAGSGDHLYFDDGAEIVRWDSGQRVTRVIEGSWSRPIASSDRQHIAYEVMNPGEPAPRIRVFDVTGATSTQLPGMGFRPVFLNDTTIHRSLAMDCPHACGHDDYFDYDLTTGSDVTSPFYYIFSTWPRGTPGRSGGG